MAIYTGSTGLLGLSSQQLAQASVFRQKSQDCNCNTPGGSQAGFQARQLGSWPHPKMPGRLPRFAWQLACARAQRSGMIRIQNPTEFRTVVVGRLDRRSHFPQIESRARRAISKITLQSQQGMPPHAKFLFGTFPCGLCKACDIES
jgi:hypothetical protein